MSSTGDPLAAMIARISGLERSLTWTRDDPTWPDRARAAVAEAVGVVNEPWEESSLDIRTMQQLEGYRRLRVEFPSHEGWNGRGWLLIPDHPTGPAIVCLPGHGKGADAIVGIAEEPYQADFAWQCVQQGWVTLAVEQVSFGSNRSSRERESDSSCVLDSMAALLLGETVTGWRVRDAMAARRALGTLPEVDPERIGVLGISGGGLTALWSAALDPGFLVAGVSGYFCPMSHSILAVFHCPDNYVPGFAKLMDIPDLAGLIAPRWLAVESGTRDPLFLMEGFLQACDLATEIYRNTPERFLGNAFEGEHIFNGQALFSHFRRAFNQPLI